MLVEESGGQGQQGYHARALLVEPSSGFFRKKGLKNPFRKPPPRNYDMPASELGHNIYIYFSKKLQAIFLNFKLQIKYLQAYTAY